MNILPPPCKGGCGRPIRPRNANPADYPDNVKVEKGRGYCGKCYVPVGAEDPTANPCKGCETKMRPNGTSIDDHPDTKEHSGSGYCTTCRSRLRRGLDLDRDIAPTPVVIDPSYERFKRTRQERLERLRKGQEAAQRMELARSRFIAQRQAA